MNDANLFGKAHSPMHYCCCSVASVVSNSATPWSVACPSLLPVGLSRQEYWGGLPCPLPGETSRPRDWNQVFCISGWVFFFTTVPPEKPIRVITKAYICALGRYCSNSSVQPTRHLAKMKILRRTGVFREPEGSASPPASGW